MFDFWKKKEEHLLVAGAPMDGEAIPLSQVPDPTFGDEILGKGAAIVPTEGKVYAPADGKVTLLFDTLHAVTITSTEGAEILIHVGLDTVELKGKHFKAHVAAGDAVKKGDLLLEADLDAIQAAGYQTVTPVVVCNTEQYQAVEGLTGKKVKPGEDFIRIR